MSTSKLVAFLYVLMRDDVVPGRVEQLLRDHVECGNAGDETIYCNPHLEALAKETAERLRGDR